MNLASQTLVSTKIPYSEVSPNKEPGFFGSGRDIACLGANLVARVLSANLLTYVVEALSYTENHIK